MSEIPNIGMKDILEKLSNTEPIKPRGWFRWLHCRLPLHDQKLAQMLEDQGWNALAAKAGSFEVQRSDELLAVLNWHGWSAGQMKLISLAEACWKEMPADQRGAFIAGLSETRRPQEHVDWISSHLSDATFTAESACQIACNAIRNQQPDILRRVLVSGTDLSATIHREDVWDHLGARWPEELKQLSHRVIDMILEAALIQNNTEGVRLALGKGASPDIPIWDLERSFSEKHCALSWAIANEQRESAELLLEHGASATGTSYATLNHPLYLAIRNDWDDLAKKLMERGASFFVSAEPEQKTTQEPGGAESEVISPSGRFFCHFKDELQWAEKKIGSIVPLVPIEEKPAFYIGTGQGGHWVTFLGVLVGDLPRLKHYESLGLDTRLTADELCSAIHSDAFDGLVYLLSKHGPEVRDRALFRIRHRKPEFGADWREIETLPQPDGINTAMGFNPSNQSAFVLPDGSKLFVDLEAIAPTDHRHGPCLEGHFWLRIDEAIYRRRQERVIVTAFSQRWAMTATPENRYQLDDLLPCVKEVDKKFIRLGVTIGQLANRIRPRAYQDLLYQWFKSAAFQSVIDEATRRIQAQDAANIRPKKPTLTDEELKGYPTVFWPYLVRLPNKLIGMTESSCRENPDMLDLYQVWARQNKTEESFVPDPRILSWESWNEVPPELKPFFEFDPMLQRPGVRHKAGNDYEKAMISKAIAWWNAWIMPRILAQIEQLEAEKDDAKGKEGTSKV